MAPSILGLGGPKFKKPKTLSFDGKLGCNTVLEPPGSPKFKMLRHLVLGPKLAELSAFMPRDTKHVYLLGDCLSTVNT